MDSFVCPQLLHRSGTRNPPVLRAPRHLVLSQPQNPLHLPHPLQSRLHRETPMLCVQRCPTRALGSVFRCTSRHPKQRASSRLNKRITSVDLPVAQRQGGRSCLPESEGGLVSVHSPRVFEPTTCAKHQRMSPVPNDSSFFAIISAFMMLQFPATHSKVRLVWLCLR
jgi:hypothetical protein